MYRLRNGERRTADGGLRALAAALVLVCATSPLDAQDARLALVPWPQRVEPGSAGFTVRASTTIQLRGRHADLDRLGRLARDIVREATGRAPRVTRRAAPGAISLVLDEPQDSTDESYALTADSVGIAVAARSPRGLFYGLQTLRQLLAPDGTVPAVRVEDAPRFRWRGMHLDVGRHFFPVAFIKRYIDLLARYKLNTFHWHLTEDQGWRLEVRRYPRLTTVGSCRRETMVERNFDPYVGDGRRYCGFYTQAEVREIVRYAAERYVTVVPEIEMPGHSVAALAAYPELACTEGPFEVHTRWGVTEDIFCPSEATFTFLENVLREVMVLFPSTFIHIGGDEAPKRRWRESPLAQEVIRREGLRNEEELQSWFIRRIERFLGEHGRRLIGWDEILEGGLPPRATVMSWRGTAGGIEAARAGHDVVMTPTSHLYFDYYQGEPRFEPLAIGGFLPLERVYAFEPVPDSFSVEEARRILGAQGNVWTEYMRTSAQVEYMALPRMLALAEVVWSPREARSWDSFVARLPARLRELDALGVNYRIPNVAGLEEDRITLADSYTVELRSPIAEAVIRVTTDSSLPTAGSPAAPPRFTVPVHEGGVVVTARLFLPNGRAGPPRAARFTRTTWREAAAPDSAALAPGLRVTYHEAERLGRVAQLDTLPVVRDTVLPEPGLPPFVRAENFGLRLSGWVHVPEDAIWRFRLTSDDGSALWIGERLVVLHDGLHGMEERSGLIALRRGYHPVRLGYFQRGGGRGLTLVVERDGAAAREPAAWFHSRP